MTTMTAADLMARAEQRAKTLRLSASAARILGAVLVIVGVFLYGRHVGQSDASLDAVNAALQANAVQLAANARAMRAADQHRDSTRAVAQQAVARSDALRPTTRAAQSRVAIINDSVVGVTVAPDVVLHDTIPPAVVTELRADRAQIQTDSITIRAQAADITALEAQVGTRDRRIALLEQRATDEEAKEKLVAGASFRSGLRWGAIGTAAIALVIHAIW